MSIVFMKPSYRMSQPLAAPRRALTILDRASAMSTWSNLPNELLVHIMWLSHYRDVLRMRLVNSFCKAIVDSSSQLRLLVELGRDGQYPIYCSATSSVVNTLDRHLWKRDRWARFILSTPRFIPPQDHEFNLYEFTGGTLAHCVPGTNEDSISFQALKEQNEMHEALFGLNEGPRKIESMYNVPLAFHCAEFSFDLTQDLLMLVEERSPNYPVHILSASTGGYHYRASTTVFDKFVETHILSAHGHGLDVEIVINEHIVALAYRLEELQRHVLAVVFNWVTGETLLHQVVAGASSITLLSPRYLMAVRCGYLAENSSLDIFDLEVDRAARQDDEPTPFVRLLLLELSEHRLKRNTFGSAYFMQATHNSASTDSWGGTARTSETDVVCIQIWMTRDEPDQMPPRFEFFASKNRLIKVASDAFMRNSEAPKAYPPSQEEFLTLAEALAIVPSFEVQPLQEANDNPPICIQYISYAEWTELGRYTRWLDGTNLLAMTRCTTLGSKFACVGSPYDLGLGSHVATGGTDRGFVCVLEFNKRLFPNRNSPQCEGIVTQFENQSSLVNGLDRDVRGGMAYKITWYKKPSAAQWLDLLLDSDHLVARLKDGFRVYEI